jgi:hypothetical protein
MIEVFCETCGKLKLIKPSEAKRNDHCFCDRTCYGQWKSQQQIGIKNSSWKGGQKKSICKYCENEFLHYVHNSYKKQDFCSLKCYDAWRKKQSETNITICTICGKVKQSTPSRLKKGIDKTCFKNM